MALYDSKFISTAYLKEQTPIQGNVDDNILVPYIKMAQKIHIQQMLGSAFYNHLCEAIANNSLTSDEVDLLRDYIQPCLAQFTFYEVLPHLNYKPTNKAVSQENSEYSTSSGLDDIKYLRQTVRDMAEFLLSRLHKQLCDYSELYPLYLNPGDKENLQKKNNSYFSGIYLPNSRPSGIRTYDDPSDDCEDC